MRNPSIVLTLLLASTMLPAQTATGSNPAVLVSPPVSNACPVGFSVDRRPQGAVIWTSSESDRIKNHGNKNGQGLNINFAKPATQIVSADITVHGYSATPRVIPAAPSTPGEVSETFHLTASAGTPLLHSSIWTNHIASVNWVELKRLEYADGTTWQPSTARQCGATPSLYLLVDSAR